MADNSRPPNSRSNTGTHVPAQPSGLRKSHNLSHSSESLSSGYDGSSAASQSQHKSPDRPDPPLHLDSNACDPPREIAGPSAGYSSSRQPPTPTAATPLLRGVLDHRECSNDGHGNCNHGTFSPRPQSPAGTASIRSSSDTGFDDTESEGTDSPMEGLVNAITGHRGSIPTWRRRMVRRIQSRKMTQSRELAARYGIEDSGFAMYLSYYIPSISWMRQYKLSYLKGDLVSAATIAGIYLPMALSYADNLAHVPPINGLYAFVFNPIIYALLGSCPMMVVGPEAPGSLLVGTVIRSSVDRGRGGEEDDAMHARLVGVIGGIASATVLSAGLFRLGYLDSVLSRPFLRGFISAIGVVIFVDQLIPELGLAHLASRSNRVAHGSTVDKLSFLFSNFDRVHKLTAIIAGVSFTLIMVFRELKRRMLSRYPGVAYIPDRLVIVAVSAWMAYYFDWQSRGVEILGEVKPGSGALFEFNWPFQPSNLPHIRDAMSTSFLIALLGFFESSVAAKSLGGQEIFPDIQLSPNRELVALGTANLVGACFMSLPAFGGYGRSKVNKTTGGKSPMSSIFLGIITLFAIFFLLPYFYFLPKPVLCSMISVVAWSLIEECPEDVFFFIRIRALPELGLMLIIVLATIFYSLNLGIAIGIGLSLLQVIRHSTRPRIQILGRIPGTQRFENAEDHPERLEFVEGCLIVKIPEPLTFANTGELKTRLRRLELYGTSQAHPAMPRLRRDEHNKNVIFDIHGVTSMDGSGTQVLEEIVRAYRKRGVRVFFSRGPNRRSHPVRRLMENSGILEMIGGERFFVHDVDEALKMTEVSGE